MSTDPICSNKCLISKKQHLHICMISTLQPKILAADAVKHEKVKTQTFTPPVVVAKRAGGPAYCSCETSRLTVARSLNSSTNNSCSESSLYGLSCNTDANGHQTETSPEVSTNKRSSGDEKGIS